MAVERIDEFPITGVAKVILKPTKAFPNGGWFYTDIEHLDLVEKYKWYLAKYRKSIIYIRAYKGKHQSIFFHQALAGKLLGYNPECIDHINGLEIDNTDRNLNVVTSQQNNRNTPSRGYKYDIYGFIPHIIYNYKTFHDTIYKSETEAALATYYLRQQYFLDYDYNFFLDRRNDLDIVDLQYTGKICEEEATFRHVMRYARDNAWYIYRYNLFDYFRQYNVPIPQFSLDSQGYMIHPISGQRLCPY